MKNTNWLANIFDWFGESFERFNPSAFRFLAAALPYLTPMPVAWLTSNSSAEFLHFPREISFIFVFALEGIGLWFTALLVDAVVDWVRSKNAKTLSIVLMFVLVVSAYIMILVNLNVTLERAVGNSNPAISRVITLLCFLPLITGVGNGYYKLKLDYKAEIQRERELEEKHREQERLERMEIDEKLRLERLEKYKIRHGNNGKSMESSGNLPTKVESFQESSKKVPDWRKTKDKLSIDELERLAGLTPDNIRQFASETGFTYKTISNWRNNARQELQTR